MCLFVIEECVIKCLSLIQCLKMLDRVFGYAIFPGRIQPIMNDSIHLLSDHFSAQSLVVALTEKASRVRHVLYHLWRGRYKNQACIVSLSANEQEMLARQDRCKECLSFPLRWCLWTWIFLHSGISSIDPPETDLFRWSLSFFEAWATSLDFNLHIDVSCTSCDTKFQSAASDLGQRLETSDRMIYDTIASSSS